MKNLAEHITQGKVDVIYDPNLIDDAICYPKLRLIKLPIEFKGLELTPEEEREFIAFFLHESGHVVKTKTKSKYQVINELEAHQWAIDQTSNYILFSRKLYKRCVEEYTKRDELDKYIVARCLGCIGITWEDKLSIFVNENIRIIDNILKIKSRKKREELYRQLCNKQEEEKEPEEETSQEENNQDSQDNNGHSNDQEEQQEKETQEQTEEVTTDDNTDDGNTEGGVTEENTENNELTEEGSSSTGEVKDIFSLGNFIKEKMEIHKVNTKSIEKQIKRLLEPFVKTGQSSLVDDGEKLDSKKLYKLRLGDTNVFKANKRKQKSNTKIVFCYDCSGSMLDNDITKLGYESTHTNGTRDYNKTVYRWSVCEKLYASMLPMLKKLRKKGLHIENWSFGSKVHKTTYKSIALFNDRDSTNIFFVKDEINSMDFEPYHKKYLCMITDVKLVSKYASGSDYLQDMYKLKCACDSKGVKLIVFHIGTEKIEIDELEFPIQKVISEAEMVSQFEALLRDVRI